MSSRMHPQGRDPLEPIIDGLWRWAHDDPARLQPRMRRFLRLLIVVSGGWIGACIMSLLLLFLFAVLNWPPGVLAAGALFVLGDVLLVASVGIAGLGSVWQHDS